jgi:hypothetical protein
MDPPECFVAPTGINNGIIEVAAHNLMRAKLYIIFFVRYMSVRSPRSQEVGFSIRARAFMYVDAAKVGHGAAHRPHCIVPDYLRISY